MKKINTMQPAVSIALCTYNGEPYLIEQLESILNQDYNNISEIICIDDGSKDGTIEILKKYANQHPAFKIFQNKSNLGFIKNYEKAISMASNPYIAISDQDDIWYPDKISKLVTTIGNSLMVYSDNEFVDAKGKKMGIRFSDKRNLAVSSSCLNFALFNVVSGHTTLLRRELLVHALPFPVNIHYDWWLAFCAAQQNAIQVVHEPLVGYRQHLSNAVGGYGVKQDKKDEHKFYIEHETGVRIRFFSETIAPHLIQEKHILEFLALSYTDRSFKMRIKRTIVFWQNRDNLLLFKKRSKLRKMFYCFKAFWKYD